MLNQSYRKTIVCLVCFGLPPLALLANPQSSDSQPRAERRRAVLIDSQDLPRHLAEAQRHLWPKPVGHEIYIVQFSRVPLARLIKSTPKQRVAASIALTDEHKKFLVDVKRFRKGMPGDFPDPRFEAEYFTALNGVAIRLAAAEIPALRKLAYVTHIERDFPVETHLNRSVKQIRADQVHNQLNLTGHGVVVAIIDTGVDYTHEGLGGAMGPEFKVIGGYDFINGDDDPMDDHGHGTHVAGIVAAEGQLSGVAFDARLMAYKVLNANGRGSANGVISGIERALNPDQDPATNDQVDILNLSLGGPGHPDDAACEAIANATSSGVLCVISAGNAGFYESIGSPGLAPDAITVGAADRQDKLAVFSSRGPAIVSSDIKPDVCAPGTSIQSLKKGGGYVPYSGTSMAAPHVAGAAALLLERHPEWSPAKLKSALTQTAIDMGLNVMGQGSGRIDAFAAVTTPVLAEPSSIHLGFDDLPTGTFTVEKTLQLTNVSSQSIPCRLTIDDSRLPVGVTADVDSDVTIDPGISKDVSLKLSIDNGTVPFVDTGPFVLDGAVLIQGGNHNLRIPFSVNREHRDAYEPNNSQSEAKPIEVTESRQQVRGVGRTSIHPTQHAASDPDEDWFRFAGQAGQVFFAYVDASRIRSPLDPTLELYDAQQQLLASGIRDGRNCYLAFVMLPETADYSLRIAASGETVGPYRLYCGFLPKEAQFVWSPPQEYGRIKNPVHTVSFSDAGNYLYSSRHYHYLTLHRTLGNGTPAYHATRGAESWIIDGGIGSGGSEIGFVKARFYHYYPHVLKTARDGSLAVSAFQHFYNNDTWLMQSGQWAELPTADSPGYLCGHQMVYDSAKRRVLLFGGRDDDVGFRNSIWVFDGMNWKHLPVEGRKPEPRRCHGMVYDKSTGHVLVYGGEMGFWEKWAFDTWKWDGQSWSKITTRGAPRLKYPAMAFDEHRNVAVLFGEGDDGEGQTWEYNGLKGSWKPIDCTHSPKPGFYYVQGMCYDAARRKTVLVDPMHSDTGWETWTWDGQDWHEEEVAPVTSRKYADLELAYDSDREVVVQMALVPGTFGQLETWEWNGVAWSRVSSTRPWPRTFLALVYDAARKASVLNGGMAHNAGVVSALEGRRAPQQSMAWVDHIRYPEMLTGLAVSPDGSRIITATENRHTDQHRLQVRDANGMQIKSYPRPSRFDVARLTNNGIATVVEHWTNEADVALDISDGSERFREAGTRGQIRVSGDGSWLVQTLGRVLYAKRWNGRNAYETVWRYEPPGNEAIRGADVSDDANVVFAVGCRLRGASGETGVTYYCLDGMTGQLHYRYYQPEAPRIPGVNGINGLSINARGTLVGVSTKGRDKRHGQAMAFSTQAAIPIFETAAPETLRSFDLAGNFLALGSARIHNIYRGPFIQGEVLAIDLTPRLKDLPPLVTDIRSEPWKLKPGDPLHVRCKAIDASGVDEVVAELEAPDENVLATVMLYDDGKHSDGEANDHVWGGTWQTDRVPRTYNVDLVATDQEHCVATHNNARTVTTAPNPWLSIQDVKFESNSADPGENYYQVTVKNIGDRSAAAISVYASHNDPYILPESDTMNRRVDLVDLAPADTVTTDPRAFGFVLADNVPQEHVMAIDFVLEDDAHTWHQQIHIPVKQKKGGAQR